MELASSEPSGAKNFWRRSWIIEKPAYNWSSEILYRVG